MADKHDSELPASSLIETWETRINSAETLIIGRKAAFIVIDDPVPPRYVRTKEDRQKAEFWFNHLMAERLKAVG